MQRGLIVRTQSGFYTVATQEGEVVCHLRGRCVAIGDGFVWLYDDTLDWNRVAHEPVKPVLVGLESLRVLVQAARHCRLSDSQVEGIFGGNLRRLLERVA